MTLSTRGVHALWVAGAVVAGVILPAGGFGVVLLSLLPRLRDTRPSLWLLVAIAAAALALQLIGMLQGSLGHRGVDSAGACRGCVVC